MAYIRRQGRAIAFLSIAWFGWLVAGRIVGSGNTECATGAAPAEIEKAERCNSCFGKVASKATDSTTGTTSTPRGGPSFCPT
jgi:hypothetical protein